MQEHLSTVTTGTIGFTTSIGAAVVSLDPMLDFQLRIASLVIGILVGLASFSKLVYDIYADHKARNKK